MLFDHYLQCSIWLSVYFAKLVWVSTTGMGTYNWLFACLLYTSLASHLLSEVAGRLWPLSTGGVRLVVFRPTTLWSWLYRDAVVCGKTHSTHECNLTAGVGRYYMKCGKSHLAKYRGWEIPASRDEDCPQPASSGSVRACHCSPITGDDIKHPDTLYFVFVSCA